MNHAKIFFVGNSTALMVPTLLRPKSKGTVRLKNNDPMTKPEINPNYLSEQIDIDVIVGGLKFANRMVESKALQSIGASNWDPDPGCKGHKFGTDKYWECFTRFIFSSVTQ